MEKTKWLVLISLILLAQFCSLFAADGDTSGVLLLPEGISVELFSSQRGTLMLTGQDGRAQLPQGQYRLESWTLTKTDQQGNVWKLSGDLMTAKMIEVGSEPVRLDIQAEPIACRLDVIMASQAVNFTLGLTGPAGERLRVDGPGVKRDNLPQPSFELYNSDRSFFQTYDFESQCCGNFRLSWTPPSGVQGPFWINVKAAGPFALDFQPRTLSDLSEQTAAKMQAAKAQADALQKQQQRAVLTAVLAAAAGVGLVMAAAVFLLIKFYKPSASPDEAKSKKKIKRLTAALAVAGLCLLLNIVLQEAISRTNVKAASFQIISIAAVLLIGGLLVWIVRKAPVKWPFVTIMLYGILFIFFLMPFLFLVFLTAGRTEGTFFDTHLSDWGQFYTDLFTFPEFGVWIVWLLILAMLAVQASLLIIPVRISHGRPRPQRGIWLTAVSAGLLYTVLLFFAVLSIMAAVFADALPEPLFWILVCILPVSWAVWAVVFGLTGRSMTPDSFIRRLMQRLIAGSILELLIAVPSHIIVRHRDVCCAHGLTAAGITAGLAVIFFAFGPGLYFLYADRIRSRRPNLSPSIPQPPAQPQVLP